MDPCVEVFLPSRLYARAGWSALAAAALASAFATRSPIFVALLVTCAVSSSVLLWLSVRPIVRVGETQFNIGDRAIAWREVREINRVKSFSLLILRIKLTNARKRLLIYPGEPGRMEQLAHLLRKNSHLATFNGVAYRDYWTWSSMAGLQGEKQTGQPQPGQKHADKPFLDQPVRMLSNEDEDEIERMYLKLKTVGHLDSRVDPSVTEE